MGTSVINSPISLTSYLEDVESLDSNVEIVDGATDSAVLAEDEPDNTQDDIQVLTQIPR